MANASPVDRGTRTIACTNCIGIMHPAFETRDYNRGVSDEVFRYYRCRRRGLISLGNVPEAIGPYYAAGWSSIRTRY